jgi:hypothetical protein
VSNPADASNRELAPNAGGDVESVYCAGADAKEDDLATAPQHSDSLLADVLPDSPDKSEAPALSPQGWVDGLSGVRDAALVVVGCIYVFGYVTWAIYAFMWKLGPMPALDAQYFVAGLIPFLSTVGLAGVVWLVNSIIRERLLRLSRWRRFVWTLPWIGVGIALMWIPFTDDTLQAFSRLFGLLLMLLTIYASDDDALGMSHRSKGTLYLLFMGLAVAVIYTIGGFAYIPQEFGGGAPRCAYLEVDQSAIGAGVQQRLIRNDKERLEQPDGRMQADFRRPEDDQTDNDRHIVRSDPLYVWHMNEDSIIVRNHTGIFNLTQLPMTAVRSIRWITGEASEALCPWRTLAASIIRESAKSPAK